MNTNDQATSTSLVLRKDPRTLSTMKSKASFTCFPRLPAELRIKIWKMASEESQTVKYLLNPGTRWPRYYGHLRYSGIPGVLHATPESRYESQKHNPEWAFDTLAAATLPKGRSLMRFLRKDHDIAFIQEDGELGQSDFGTMSDALRTFSGFETLALGDEFYFWAKGAYLASDTPFFMPDSCKHLFVVLKDTERKWTWAGEKEYGVSFSEDDEDWTETKERNEHQEIVRAGEIFRKVTINTKYADYLKIQFMEAKKVVLDSQNRMSLANRAVATMDLEVVSE